MLQIPTSEAQARAARYAMALRRAAFAQLWRRVARALPHRKRAAPVMGPPRPC